VTGLAEPPLPRLIAVPSVVSTVINTQEHQRRSTAERAPKLPLLFDES
jgi:hypothetical protein